MMPSRLGLQTKIIIIVASSVIFLLGASTIVAMILTRQPVEEEVYRKALVQARLTAHNLINDRCRIPRNWCASFSKCSTTSRG
jgi:sensor histidine kinase regulating citrate/malate metabolism